MKGPPPPVQPYTYEQTSLCLIKEWGCRASLRSRKKAHHRRCGRTPTVDEEKDVVYMYMYMYMYIYLPIYISINLSIYQSIYLSIYLSIYIHIYIYIYIHVCVCVCVCVYTRYTYIYINISGSRDTLSSG